MSIGLPGHLRPQVIARAYTAAAHLSAAIGLAAVFLVVASLQFSRPDLILWPALIALVPPSIMLWYLNRNPTVFATAAYLVVGGASVYWFSLIVMTQFTLSGTDSFPLSAVRIAMFLVSGPGGMLSAVAWGLAGLAIAEAAILFAALQVGDVPISPDLTSIAIAVLSVVLLIVIRFSLRRSHHAQPALHRAARDEELAGVRFEIETRAAAVMHDTVLGHLSALALAENGPLPAELRRQIDRDLAILVGEEWLAEQAQPAAADWQGSPLLGAIEESRRMGLDVEVSGDLSAVGRLDAERSRALGLAAKQCLVNVLRHSGTDHAEVVVYGSDADVTVMVVDQGKGFEVGQTPADRLGIRQSIRRRLEAAGGEMQLWSNPGFGTSVLLRLPTGEIPA